MIHNEPIMEESQEVALRRSQEIQIVITFIRISDSGARYIETLEIEDVSSRQIQTTITFDSGVCVRPMIYRKARK